MDSSYYGRIATRRRALAESASRGNENRPAKRDAGTSSSAASSKRPPLPHNESIVPNGTLAVRHEQVSPTPTDKRISALQAHEARTRNSKRDSEISNASTNASNTNRRKKTHIGPWQLGKTIGKGGCSRVRLVRHSVTGQMGAAKIIPKATAEKMRALSLANLIASAEHDPSLSSDGKIIPFGLEREICIMKLLDHPHIVRLYDIWENRDELYLIMEYVEGGELFNYIHEGKNGLSELKTVHIFRQILAALIYCHRINIHHRDLKPENILLDRENMTVKLVDFGMAALQPVGGQLTTPCGSPHYAAPEVIKQKSYDGAKADVWSCGVILCVLLTGVPPFNYSGDERHLTNLFRDISEARYVMPNVSKEAQDLIRKILVVDPKRRIDLNSMWYHPFMHKYAAELGFEGIAATQEYWTGPLPAIEDWTALDRTTIDREIMRYLRTLWHSEKEEVLVQRLMSKEPNQEKYFYSALRKYHTDQLENYQPSAHYPVAYSSSDHHHHTRIFPTREDLEKLPTKKHNRSQSAYSILNDEHLYSKHSFYEPPASEASYDPFRSSRQPIIPELPVVHQNITVHNRQSNDSQRLRPVTALGHRPGSSLRVQALRNNSKRSSAMSRGSSYRSTPSNRVILSFKRSSMSRLSLASSHYPSSPPRVVRSGGLAKRGVSFSHLRKRHSSVATAGTWVTEVSCADDTPTHRPHTSIGTYGSSRPASTTRTSSSARPRIRGAFRGELPALKHRKPESPTKYIHSEARKVSMELGKVMEEAFNRASVSSSIRTSGTTAEGFLEDSQYETPPTSFANTRDSGGSDITTPQMRAILAQRPLPPIPAETPNTFLHRKLLETRTEIAQKICEAEGDDTTERFVQVLNHLDRLIVPVVDGKRTVSAPAKSPENPSPLHVIPEEVRSESGDGLDPATPHYRSVTDPVRPPPLRRVATDRQPTIRLVDQSPTRIPAIAPLNIRKRSSGATSDRVTEGDAEPRNEETYNESIAPNKQNAGVKKKKSLWFRRNADEEDREQSGQDHTLKKKKSTGLRQIPESWQGLDDRVKNDPVLFKAQNQLSSKHAHPQSESSNSSEFPMRNTSSAAGRSDGSQKKGFFGFFGKKNKDEKPRNPMELGAINFSSSSIFSDFDLEESNGGGNNRARSGPPEVQMNWLSRFLHIKPATRTLCFRIGRGKVRQDLVRLLRDWQRFGVHDVSFDRNSNSIHARVDKNNHLKIKPVMFVIELFVVLEHGRRANLCLARFTQTRGAASSFRKVVDIVEDVCRARCMLIEDEEKKAAMMEVLG